MTDYETRTLRRMEKNSKQEGPLYNGVPCRVLRTASLKGGHKIVWFKGKYVLAHRLAMHLLKKFDLLSNKQINHGCNNPGCWETEHLYEGNQQMNMHDRYVRLTVPAGY